MFGEIVPRDEPSVPVRPRTVEERAVFRKWLYNIAREDATDNTTAYATEIRARQEVRSVKEIARAVTEVLAVVDSLPDPRAQEFMKKYVGPSLMNLAEDVEDYKQASADVTTGIIREAYPVGIERPPTLLDFFFPPKD